MSKSQWEQFPKEFRDTVIFLFNQQGLDFEKICLTDEKSSKQTSEAGSPWMSRKEAADYAGVSTDTVDNWCKNGKIKYIKLAEGRPGSKRIDRNSLRRFLNSKIKANPDKRDRFTPMKGSRYRVNNSY